MGIEYRDKPIDNERKPRRCGYCGETFDCTLEAFQDLHLNPCERYQTAHQQYLRALSLLPPMKVLKKLEEDHKNNKHAGENHYKKPLEGLDGID